MTGTPPGSSGLAESTSVSLIERVQAREPNAWQRFSDLYTPLVYTWARRGGLQDSDACDVVQEVFRGVLLGIDRFEPHKESASFRSWLWTITRNQVRLVFRRRSNTLQLSPEPATVELPTMPGYFASDEAPADAESDRDLVRRALGAIQADFSPTTWQAFEQMSLQNRSAGEAAAMLGLSENAIRQAKFRVLQRLRQELSLDFDPRD